MAPKDGYVKASGYDLKGQGHNFRLFTRHLMAHPWHALIGAFGFDVLGMIAAFNLIEGPRWALHPWQGWILAGLAFCVSGYLLICALLGWRGTDKSNP